MKTSSNALINFLHEKIKRENGQISFADYMETVLYHPDWGYYNQATFALGKEGDFTTAPEISPLFAQCLARQCLQIFTILPHGNFLELGAGSGQFAFDMLLSLDQLGFLPTHYFIYDINLLLRKKQQERLGNLCSQIHREDLFKRLVWLDELPTHFEGIIFANEVLDALPVHCFHIEEKSIKEKYVTYQNNHFTWQFNPPSSQIFAENIAKIRDFYHLAPGYESEINLRLPSFIANISRALARGVILLADYGYGQREYYHPERKRGTLTCFYQHHHHNNPFLHIGAQDITAHVDFTKVIDEASNHDCSLLGFTTQAAFLLSCGLLELAQEQEKNLSSIDEIKLHQDIKTLTFPTEMGDLVKFMALGKNYDLPLLGFGIQDRRRDL